MFLPVFPALQQSQSRFSPSRLASAEAASHELQGHTSAVLTSLKSILDEDKNQASVRLSQLSKEISGYNKETSGYNPAGRESIESLRALLQGGQGLDPASTSDLPSTLPPRTSSYASRRSYPLTASDTADGIASTTAVATTNRNSSPSLRTIGNGSRTAASTALRSNGSSSSNVSPLHPASHHHPSSMHYLSDSSVNTANSTMRPRPSVRGSQQGQGTPTRGQRQGQGQGAGVGAAMHAKENMGTGNAGPSSTNAIAFKHTDGYSRDDSSSGAKRMIVGSSTKRHAKVTSTPSQSKMKGRQPRGLVATTIAATASKDKEISALSLRIRQRLLSGP